MATISVAKVQPRRHVQARSFPEGASQTFVRGDLLTFSGTTDTGHRVIKATSGTTITKLVGFAAEAASGTAGTSICVYLAEELSEFVGNVCTAVSADDTIDNDDLGLTYGLSEDTTNAAWRVDLSQTSADNKIVVMTEIIDAAGDTNGRVAFRLLKTNVSTTATSALVFVRAF